MHGIGIAEMDGWRLRCVGLYGGALIGITAICVGWGVEGHDSDPSVPVWSGSLSCAVGTGGGKRERCVEGMRGIGGGGGGGGEGMGGRGGGEGGGVIPLGRESLDVGRKREKGKGRHTFVGQC